MISDVKVVAAVNNPDSRLSWERKARNYRYPMGIGECPDYHVALLIIES